MSLWKSMRFGIIGCGEIGSLRAQALSGLQWNLVAVADLDNRRAETLAMHHGAQVLADWRELIRRNDIEAVLVCTPPNLHAEMCLESLQAGKSVLCEKPLARTTEECRAILKRVEEVKGFLATGFNYRFYPSIQKARQALDSGEIGELDHIRSYAGYSAREHSHSWIHEFDFMGGGALKDNGIHLIDLTRYFLGEVTEAKSYSSNSVWKFPHCEDNGFLLLRNGSGKIASLHASWTEWNGYRFRLEIYGSRGCITTTCFPMITRIVSAVETGGNSKKHTYFFPKTHLMEHLRSYKWVIVQSFMEELKAFADGISGKQTTIATAFDGLRAVEIAETEPTTFPC